VDDDAVVWVLFVFPIWCCVLGFGVWHVGKHYRSWPHPALLGWLAGVGALVCVWTIVANT
jgi:hypothetical protein